MNWSAEEHEVLTGGLSAAAESEFKVFCRTIQRIVAKGTPKSFDELVEQNDTVLDLCDAYSVFARDPDPDEARFLEFLNWSASHLDRLYEELVTLGSDPSVQERLLAELRLHYEQLDGFAGTPEESDGEDVYGAFAYPWLDDAGRPGILLTMSLRYRVVAGEMDGLAVVKGPRWWFRLLAMHAIGTEVIGIDADISVDVLSVALGLWEPLDMESPMHHFRDAHVCAEMLSV